MDYSLSLEIDKAFSGESTSLFDDLPRKNEIDTNNISNITPTAIYDFIKNPDFIKNALRDPEIFETVHNALRSLDAEAEMDASMVQDQTEDDEKIEVESNPKSETKNYTVSAKSETNNDTVPTATVKKEDDPSNNNQKITKKPEKTDAEICADLYAELEAGFGFQPFQGATGSLRTHKDVDISTAHIKKLKFYMDSVLITPSRFLKFCVKFQKRFFLNQTEFIVLWLIFTLPHPWVYIFDDLDELNLYTYIFTPDRGYAFIYFLKDLEELYKKYSKNGS